MHLLLCYIFFEKCGGMNKAFKVEFLRNVSFFNIDHGGSW